MGIDNVEHDATRTEKKRDPQIRLSSRCSWLRRNTFRCEKRTRTEGEVLPFVPSWRDRFVLATASWILLEVSTPLPSSPRFRPLDVTSMWMSLRYRSNELFPRLSRELGSEIMFDSEDPLASVEVDESSRVSLYSSSSPWSESEGEDSDDDFEQEEDDDVDEDEEDEEEDEEDEDEEGDRRRNVSSSLQYSHLKAFDPIDSTSGCVEDDAELIGNDGVTRNDSLRMDVVRRERTGRGSVIRTRSRSRSQISSSSSGDDEVSGGLYRWNDPYDNNWSGNSARGETFSSLRIDRRHRKRRKTIQSIEARDSIQDEKLLARDGRGIDSSGTNLCGVDTWRASLLKYSLHVALSSVDSLERYITHLAKIEPTCVTMRSVQVSSSSGSQERLIIESVRRSLLREILNDSLLFIRKAGKNMLRPSLPSDSCVDDGGRVVSRASQNVYPRVRYNGDDAVKQRTSYFGADSKPQRQPLALRSSSRAQIGTEEPSQRASEDVLGEETVIDRTMLEEMLSLPTILHSDLRYDAYELVSLFDSQSVLDMIHLEKYQGSDAPFRPFCPFLTKERCISKSQDGIYCEKIHFRKITFPQTREHMGYCSYLDTCRHMKTCPFLHFELDTDSEEESVSSVISAEASIFMAATGISDNLPSISRRAVRYLRHSVPRSPWKLFMLRSRESELRTSSLPLHSLARLDPRVLQVIKDRIREKTLFKSRSQFITPSLQSCMTRSMETQSLSESLNFNVDGTPGSAQPSSSSSRPISRSFSTKETLFESNPWSMSFPSFKNMLMRLPADVAHRLCSFPQNKYRLPPQWISCDIRDFDFSVLGKFAVVMADPPWNIRMDLPYGTMEDDEMLNLGVPLIQDVGGICLLWVTGRAMELGRRCLRRWGYRVLEEILWIKTNQLQTLIRTGRTGHWLNHSKEHCIVAVRVSDTALPDPEVGEFFSSCSVDSRGPYPLSSSSQDGTIPLLEGINRCIDCDVILAETRETSRKPDEIYRMVDRMAPGLRKLEIFGRHHNLYPEWITLGNQLSGSHICEEDVREVYKERYGNFPDSEPHLSFAIRKGLSNSSVEGTKPSIQDRSAISSSRPDSIEFSPVKTDSTDIPSLSI